MRWRQFYFSMAGCRGIERNDSVGLRTYGYSPTRPCICVPTGLFSHSFTNCIRYNSTKVIRRWDFRQSDQACSEVRCTGGENATQHDRALEAEVRRNVCWLRWVSTVSRICDTEIFRGMSSFNATDTDMSELTFGWMLCMFCRTWCQISTRIPTAILWKRQLLGPINYGNCERGH